MSDQAVSEFANPLALSPPKKNDDVFAEEERAEERLFEEEQEELRRHSARSDRRVPVLEGHRPLRELSENEAMMLEERFKSCFDAMDSNEDGVIPNDRRDLELRAALQLQGLAPSDAQLEAWREEYGDEFTREQFVDAMMKFVGEQPGEFSATHWSHVSTPCARLDCIPVGKDAVRITADTITIERTKCRMCFCGCKRLGDTSATNIETFRSRWVHIHVPLLELVWVTAYVFEGIVVYCSVAFLYTILAPGFADQREAIEDMRWSFERVEAVRELWFGSNLIAGLVACLVWWSLRLAWQSTSKHGHAFFYSIGNQAPPGSLVDQDKIKGRLAIAWNDCEVVVDEFLRHKGCYMKNLDVRRRKDAAKKKTELHKVLAGLDEQLAGFKKAEFVVEGLKELQGTVMDGITLAVINSAAMAKALMNEPDQQVENIANLMLEPTLRTMKEDGLEALRQQRIEYESLELSKLTSRINRRLTGRVEPAVLERAGPDETDEQYQKRIVDVAMQPAELRFGFRLDPTAGHPKADEESDEQYNQRMKELPPIEGSQFDAEAKRLKSHLLAEAGVSRSEQFLGTIRLDEYARVAHLDPVYLDGEWNTKPGGRWYVWRRWWLGEETSLYIGENTFKAGSVMQFGPMCRRREHLASSTMDLVWVHAAKKGRSVRRICGWTWGLAKAMALISLAVAILWSITFPNCNQHIGCEHLEPAERIDYKHCEQECRASSCSNLTCARFNSCDDIVVSNVSVAERVASVCSAAVDQTQNLNNFSDSAGTLAGVDQIAACNAATAAAQAAHERLLNLPASCATVHDEAERAKLYKLYLDVSYFGRAGHWLGPVAYLGGENCALAAAVDKCSGCHGRERCSRDMMGESYQAHTRPGEPITAHRLPFQREGFYPSNFELCYAILEADKLPTSEFCPNKTFTPEWEMIRKPCICRHWWESFIPDLAAFFLTFNVLFGLGWIIVLYIWLRWVPETLDFGLTGMTYSQSTAGFTLPPGESMLATIDLLETKLGREMSLAKVHKPWTYTPTFRYLSLALNGFEESMTVYEDFVHVITHSGVPICCSKRLCSCCCCDPRGIWADEDNYFLLLENVTFIEVGTNFFWLFDALSQLFVRLAFFFLLVEYVFMEPLEMFGIVLKNSGVDVDAIEDSWIMKTWDLRYELSVLCFGLWFSFKILAGNVWKRGYVSLHCIPGGTERGRNSIYVGRSPFFVRLSHPDPSQFLHDIEVIRSAVKKTRMEVKRRHKERLSQLWDSLVYKDRTSASVNQFKDKIKASLARSSKEVDSNAAKITDGRVDLLEDASKDAVATQVELWLRDSRYLEYFEVEGGSVLSEANEILEAKKDDGTEPLVSDLAHAETVSRDSEAAVLEQKRRNKGLGGLIDLQSAIAVRIVPLREIQGDPDLVDLDRKDALQLVHLEGDLVFSFADCVEQNEWQSFIEAAARAAQVTDDVFSVADGSNFTRYRVQRQVKQIISDFKAAGSDPKQAELREQVARVFCAVDRNHDRTISVSELRAWLSTGSKSTAAAHPGAANVIESVQQKFQAADEKSHRIRLSLEEFWSVMNDQRIIEDLKEARLWESLVVKHVYDEETLSQMFDHVQSESGRVGDKYIDVNQVGWCFEQMGMVRPPPSQISAQMRMFDRTVPGKLTRSQFVELMIDQIHSRPGKVEFTAGLWSPMEAFGMVLDLIPWGEQVTTIDEDECITRGRTGPFASSEAGPINKTCKKHLRVEFSLSRAFLTSWEMSKARWLHTEGNPLDLQRLVGYLAEALLLYAIIASDYVQGRIVSTYHNVLGPLCCSFNLCAAFTIIGLHKRIEFYLSFIPGQQSHMWLNFLVFVASFWWVYIDSERAFGGAFGPYSAHYIVRAIAIQWFGLRVSLLLFRKIGSASMFVIGQPLHKTKARTRQRFPLQISNLRDATDAFLHVKKFDALNVQHAFREAIPGYGFIPHDLDRCQCCASCPRCTLWWRTKFCRRGAYAKKWVMQPLQTCRGLHSLYIGKQHFEVERNNGGGWRSASYRNAGWRTRITRMDHVVGFMDDIRWVLVKKQGIAFSDLVLDSIQAMGAVLVLAVPVALLSSYPCSDVLNLRGRDQPNDFALQQSKTPLYSWERWSTFNSSTSQMAHFEGAQEWCDAFDKSQWWLVDIEPSSAKSGRPCVCPLQPGEICNPNLDPSLYFKDWVRGGQPNWCSNWEQGTQFHYPYSQEPREPSTDLTGSLTLDAGWPWPNSDPPYPEVLTADDWTDGHFDHNPTLNIPLYSDAADVEDQVTGTAKAAVGLSELDAFEGNKELETEEDYRSRDQPCECLTPMSTAIPSIYILKAIFTYFLILVEPIIVLNWLKYRPWFCQLGVAALGDRANCAVRPMHAMHRLFKRRHAVEVSQNIQRLHEVLLKSKVDAGSCLVHGLDDQTIIVHDLPQLLMTDDNNDRMNLKLDTLFKRGHRAEFLGATLFKQEGSDGTGALVTVRDSGWINQVAHKKSIFVEYNPQTGPIMILGRTHKYSNRKHDILRVTQFLDTDGTDRDRLKGMIEDLDDVLETHNARVQHRYAKLHATENRHASYYRHMSANEQLNSLFRTIDGDRNGYISRDELEGLIAGEKARRVHTLFQLLKSESGKADFAKLEGADTFPDLLEKQTSDITIDDYTQVFGIKPDQELESMGQDVHEELQVRLILSKSDEWTHEEKEQVFARLPNGKLRQTVAQRLDMDRLKKMVTEEATVRPDDMRALELECKAAARIMIAKRLSVLNDNEKQELAELAEARKKAERERKQAEREEERVEAERQGIAIGQAILDESAGLEITGQKNSQDSESKELKGYEERELKTSQESEQDMEDIEEEDARQTEGEARVNDGSEEDKWALLRVRLEHDVTHVELVQGLVDVLTLPGWLEASFEAVLERMKTRRDNRKEDELIAVGVDTSRPVEEQISNSKHRLRLLANGGVDKPGMVSGNRCCGAVEDTTDQEIIDERVAVQEAHVHHLEAERHIVDLYRQKAQTDAAARSQEQAEMFDNHEELLNAELKRSDPLAARDALAMGERIVKGQFRRWLLEFLGGEEHFQFDLSHPSDDVIATAREMQKKFGTLMTPPDCSELLDIDFGDTSHRRVQESISEIRSHLGNVGSKLQRVIAEKEAVQKHVERLASGTSVVHILQDDGCLLLEASRPGIAVSIVEQRLGRPIRHGLLAEWTFIPVDAKIFGNGKYDQLLLTQDYLRLRSSLGRMCCCPAAAGCRPTTADYTMLLRDVTVIEMGSELIPWTVVLPIIWCVLLPLLWVMYWHGESSDLTVAYMNYAFGLLAFICAGIAGMSYLDDGDDGEEGRITIWVFIFLTLSNLVPAFLVDTMPFQHVAVLGTFLISYLPGAFFFSIYGNRRWILSALPPVIPVVLMTTMHVNISRCILYSVVIYILGVSISAMRGWTRRPFVYFGVLVGSTREGTGFAKGTSPFWVRMARGHSTVFLQEVVESVRNAAKMSLQQDLAYAKKNDGSTREGETTFNPVYDLDQQSNMSAAQVVVDHTVSEIGAGTLLMTMEAIPWVVTFVSNAFTKAGILFLLHLEASNEHGKQLIDLHDEQGLVDTVFRFFNPS